MNGYLHTKPMQKRQPVIFRDAECNSYVTRGPRRAESRVDKDRLLVPAGSVAIGALVNTSKNRLKVDWLATALTPSTSATAGSLCAGEHVGAAENAAQITQGHVGGIVSVGTGGVMGQELAQLLSEAFLPEQMGQTVRPPWVVRCWSVKLMRMDGTASFVSICSRTVWYASWRGPGACLGFITASPPNGAHSFNLNRSG